MLQGLPQDAVWILEGEPEQISTKPIHSLGCDRIHFMSSRLPVNEQDSRSGLQNQEGGPY